MVQGIKDRKSLKPENPYTNWVPFQYACDDQSNGNLLIHAGVSPPTIEAKCLSEQARRRVLQKAKKKGKFFLAEEKLPSALMSEFVKAAAPVELGEVKGFIFNENGSATTIGRIDEAPVQFSSSITYSYSGKKKGNEKSENKLQKETKIQSYPEELYASLLSRSEKDKLIGEQRVRIFFNPENLQEPPFVFVSKKLSSASDAKQFAGTPIRTLEGRIK
jgi:hypothetical protein